MILHLERILNNKIKDNITSECTKSAKNLCKSNLVRGNLINSANIWALGIVIITLVLLLKKLIKKEYHKIIPTKKGKRKRVDWNGKT